MGNDDAWQAFIEFSKNGFADRLDHRERWDIDTYPPRPKRTRKRRVTLSRAMRQASEAGAAVSAATIHADGSFTLQFGEAVDTSKQEKINRWDEVLPYAPSKIAIVKR